MRRILVAGSSIVVLALAGILAVGVGARTATQAPAPARHVRAVMPRAATTCYVSIRRCSQHPCVEFVGSGASPALNVPLIAPTDRCHSHATGPQVVTKAGNRATAIPPRYREPSFQLVLPSLERKLSRRHP